MSPNEDYRAALFNKLDWVTSRSWNCLHYVSDIGTRWGEWWEDDANPGYLNPEVTAICGTTIKADLPGLFSRMAMPRCKHCCRHLGIPDGNGAALNDDNLDELREELTVLYST